MYNFTSFTVSLNELQTGMEKILAPTDCRLRPDIRGMEDGNMGALRAPGAAGTGPPPTFPRARRPVCRGPVGLARLSQASPPVDPRHHAPRLLSGERPLDGSQTWARCWSGAARAVRGTGEGGRLVTGSPPHACTARGQGSGSPGVPPQGAGATLQVWGAWPASRGAQLPPVTRAGGRCAQALVPGLASRWPRPLVVPSREGLGASRSAPAPYPALRLP